MALEGGPADKTGIKSDNVLTQVNGQAVSNVVTLLNRIAQTSLDDDAKITSLPKDKGNEHPLQSGRIT